MQQTELDDKRYPRPLWLRILRWIFLHWWLTPLVCLLILVSIYFADEPLHNSLLPFLTKDWWAIILLLITSISFLFWAYKRAHSAAYLH